MRIYESDLIHYSLNLTSCMKRSYHKCSNDIFRMQDVDLLSLQIGNTSLQNINLNYFINIYLYTKKVQMEMERKYQREITYGEIRNRLRKEKRNLYLKE